MNSHSRFLYIIDRYLEVSNVYHQRTRRGSMVETEQSHLSDRVERLLALVERASPTRPETPLKMVSNKDLKGQTVAPTREFFDDTKRRQEEVLRRLNGRPIGTTPHNMMALKKVFELEPGEFLGSFPTMTYAWDILTQVASISMCPDAQTLAARDMIHMHSVELQLHLARVIAQVRLSSPTNEVSVSGCFTVEQLRRLAGDDTLVDRLIEFAVPREPARLLDDLMQIVAKSPESVCDWLERKQQEVLNRLQQEVRAFPDTLEETDVLAGYTALCDTLVVYGLVAAYAAWYPFAHASRDERGTFCMSILFCTRILLDESRWSVCSEFAAVALTLLRALNAEFKDEHLGTAMITANGFFARRMSGESLDRLHDEIVDWDTSGLHERYQFLQLILLEDFDAAAPLARRLLQIDARTGRPDMCIHELDEWPILKAFRKSGPGTQVVNEAR